MERGVRFFFPPKSRRNDMSFKEEKNAAMLLSHKTNLSSNTSSKANIKNYLDLLDFTGDGS
jgi:hypothetical protein